MTGEKPVRRFSMIRSFHFADLLTIGNGFCGVAAIFQSVRFARDGEPRYVYLAAALLCLALVLDVLDGRIARWRRKSSAMGREMDSLADVISFGVAPAVIAFTIGLDTAVDQLVLLYFAGCGLSRLARYNITAEELSGASGAVEYFEGTPIPTSLVPLALLLLAFWQDRLYPVAIAGLELHLTVLLFALSGSLMISKTIRIPKP